MEIKIPLNLSDSASTYQELKAQLKQLELAIHHAQKAVESAEKEGVVITEDSFLCYDYPALSSSLGLDRKETDDFQRSTFIDNYYEELQSPELRINLA